MPKKIGQVSLVFFLITLLFAGVSFGEDRLVIKDGSTETFKVDQTGKVYTSSYIGIGNSNPERALHISGPNGLVRIDRTYDSCGFMLTRINASGDVLKSFFFGLNASGTNSGSFFIRDYGTATGGGVYNNRLFIDNDGNIGIGTDSPVGKLDVNGSIYQRGGLVHADYVFDDQYKLETIDEHSNYMWKHKHLPAVPKARVDKSGKEFVEIGSQRRGILEELEKAHIYIDELNQRIKNLEKRIEKLSRK